MNNRSIVSSSLFNVIAACTLFSCSNNEAAQQVAPATDSAARQTIAVKADSNAIEPAAVALKNLVINEKYFIQKTKLAAVLSLQQMNALNAAKLKPDGQPLIGAPGASIKIIDTVFSGNTKWIILSRETENENWAWLAQLDNSKQILQATLVFYQDFVEYFSTTSTRISDTAIVVTTTIDNGEGKSVKIKKFRITPDQKMEPIN